MLKRVCFGVTESKLLMDWLFLALMGAALFLARDVCLLADGRPGAFWKRLLAYAVVQGSVLVALGVAAAYLSKDDALRLLRDYRFWAPAIAAHGLLGMASWWLKSGPHRWPRAWRMSLLPTPMFIYSMGGLGWWLLMRGLASEGWVVGLELAAIWLLLAGVASRVLGWRLREAGAMASVLTFAGAVNLSAILLIPFQQESSSSTLFSYAVDWKQHVLALGATAGLIATSFLYHRLRRCT